MDRRIRGEQAFEASLSGYRLSVPLDEDEIAFNEEDDKILERAMMEAQQRKRQEMATRQNRGGQ